jgi:hypothetical protein
MRISRRTILKGATVLPLAANSFGLTAVSPARVPQDLQIHRRARTGSDRNRAGSEVKLSGLVTDTPGGVQTNRPVAGAPAMWCCSTARSRPM